MQCSNYRLIGEIVAVAWRGEAPDTEFESIARVKKLAYCLKPKPTRGGRDVGRGNYPTSR
jgi:hypothetical protein